MDSIAAPETETMVNARAARAWCIQQLGSESALAKHFVAVSARHDRAREFGIDPQRIFPMGRWIGGHGSMASAAGLTLMLAIGPPRFMEMLAGFRAMDEHFLEAEPEHNLPLLMGMLALWNSDFLGANSFAVVPYAGCLHRLPVYLQQLAAERNDGRMIRDGTGPVTQGGSGVCEQHAFCQLLHPYTRPIPCDLIGVAHLPDTGQAQLDLLAASLITQGEALAFGRSAAQLHAEGVPPGLIAHQVCPGNRPSTTIVLDQLIPRSLGVLLALYEHSALTQSIIRSVDFFDQRSTGANQPFANRIFGDIVAPEEPRPTHDSSTNALIRYFRTLRAAGH